MPENNSISKLSRNFVIPAGTQVVLRSNAVVTRFAHDGWTRVNVHDSESEISPASTLPSNQEFRKSGSVGVVIKCPSQNDLPYTIQFTDGAIVEAAFDEITLRRQEIENLLIAEDADYRPFIIYRCQVGSKAFGLATDKSDDDYRGIFLPPGRQHWSMFKFLHRSNPKLNRTLSDRSSVFTRFQ